MANYAVGYKKPPQSGRFKKGTSGNPLGRPKNALNVAAIFEKTLKAKVTINEDGKPKTVTKMEAAVKRLVDRASSGDMNAFRVLAVFVQSSDAAAGSHFEADFHEADRKILDKMLLQFDSSPTQEGSSESKENESRRVPGDFAQ